MNHVGASLIWGIRFGKNPYKEIIEENKLRNVLVGFCFVVFTVVLINVFS